VTNEDDDDDDDMDVIPNKIYQISTQHSAWPSYGVVRKNDDYRFSGQRSSSI
jgi:hypothetical protein